MAIRKAILKARRIFDSFKKYSQFKIFLKFETILFCLKKKI